jgi:hypothetical protein
MIMNWKGSILSQFKVQLWHLLAEAKEEDLVVWAKVLMLENTCSPKSVQHVGTCQEIPPCSSPS